MKFHDAFNGLMDEAEPSAAELANQWAISSNVILSPLELETFHSWLELEFFCIPVPVCFTAKPVSLDKCKKIFKRFNVLFISSEHNEPNTALFTKGQNLQFRALHDWHHIKANSDSTLNGEIIAFKEAKKTASAFIHWLLFSEIVMQAAVKIHTGFFPVQKLVKHVELFPIKRNNLKVREVK
jgi:hypothetical protein